MERTAVGVFNDRERARAAVDRLIERGFSQEQISVIAVDDTGRVQQMAEATGNKAEQGTILGVISGSALGAAGGWALGMSTLLIPGMGAAVIAGPLLGALAGLVGGAAAGGLIGALIGSGIPEDEAAIYEEAIRAGGVLVAVHDTAREGEAHLILREMGADHTRSHAGGEADPGPNSYVADVSSDSQAALVGTMAASPGGVPITRDLPLEVSGAHTSGFLPTEGMVDGGTFDRINDVDIHPGAASAWDRHTPVTRGGHRPEPIDSVEHVDTLTPEEDLYRTELEHARGSAVQDETEEEGVHIRKAA